MARGKMILLVVWVGLLCPAIQLAQVSPSAHMPGKRVAGHDDSAGHTKFAGDAACLPCHQQQSLTYQHTAHHLTSQPAGKDSILGSFSDRSNTLMIKDPATAHDNPGLYFKMEAKRDGYYQVAFAGWPGQFERRSERMDVVIGSGVRGQSYLYWHGDQLYELPVSYWSDGKRWINSPGYKDGTMNFQRPITPRCIECHATFIEPRDPDPFTNHYYKESLITGISCESCHGPGSDHIAMHRAKAAGCCGISRGHNLESCPLFPGQADRPVRALPQRYSPGRSSPGILICTGQAVG